MDLQKMALRPQGGHLITSISPLLSRLADVDVFKFAAQQVPVLESFATRMSSRSAIR